MDSLRFTHPLAACAGLRSPGLTVQITPRLTLWELRGSGALHREPVFHHLPGPGRSAQHETWRANWLRPDGWLLIAAPGATSAHDTFAQLAGRGLCHLVDVTHSLVRISVAGTAARGLLAHGTPLDLRTRAFCPGDCTRTRCADFTVLLDHQAQAIDVYVDTSQALAFWSWLEDAAENLQP